MWQIGTGKWGPRRGKLDMRPGTGKPHAQVLSAEQLMPYLWALSLSLLPGPGRILNSHPKGTLIRGLR